MDAPKTLGRQPRAAAYRAASLQPLARPPCAADFEPPPLSGGDASLTLWLASADPPAGPDIVELRYGPFGERAEPAFRRAIANDEGVVVIEATLLGRGGRPDGRQPVRRGCPAGLARLRSESRALAKRDARLPGGRVGPGPRRAGRRPGARRSPAGRRALGLPASGSALGACAPQPRAVPAAVVRARPGAPRGRSRRVGRRPGPRELAAAATPMPTRACSSATDAITCSSRTSRPVRGAGSSRTSSFVPGSGSAGPPVPVLRADHHLSYPFVFAYDGEVYMIPETGEAAQIQLYRASSFPTEWELDRVLVDDIRAADATLLEAHGRWWMLASVGGYGTTLGDELHVFFAASPLGPWTPHPREPGRLRHPRRPSGRRDPARRRSSRSSGAGLLAALRLGRLAARDHRPRPAALRGTGARAARGRRRRGRPRSSHVRAGRTLRGDRRSSS